MANHHSNLFFIRPCKDQSVMDFIVLLPLSSRLASTFMSNANHSRPSYPLPVFGSSMHWPLVPSTMFHLFQVCRVDFDTTNFSLLFVTHRHRPSLFRKLILFTFRLSLRRISIHLVRTSFASPFVHGKLSLLLSNPESRGLGFAWSYSFVSVCAVLKVTSLSAPAKHDAREPGFSTGGLASHRFNFCPNPRFKSVVRVS